VTLFDLESPEPILSPWQAQQAAIEPPFQYHSETSVDAAHAIKPTADNLRQMVFEYIVEHGPVTDQRIQEDLAMDPSTQRPRRRELQQAGRVKVLDRLGVTASGRAAQRWVVA
jgi:hypothetical protein